MDIQYAPRQQLDPPWKATISLVYAGAFQRVHEIMYAMTPKDVNLVINTKLWSVRMLHEGSFDPEAFEAQTDEIVAAAVETAHFAETGFLAIGGDLIQGAMGPEWGSNVAKRAEQETGVPTATAMGAVSESLTHLGARSVTLVAPFPDERMRHLVSYLEASGFTVPVVRGLDTVTNKDIRDLPVSMPYDMMRQAASANPDVDAIYASCPVWRGANEAIELIEAEFDIPVVTMYSPILWKGLTVVGHETGVSGFGRLLRSVGAEGPAAA